MHALPEHTAGLAQRTFACPGTTDMQKCVARNVLHADPIAIYCRLLTCETLLGCKERVDNGLTRSLEQSPNTIRMHLQMSRVMRCH